MGENWKEPVPTKIHWRQIFEINGDKVSVINTTSDLDVGRNVPAKDLVTEMNNNSIVLGNGKCNLNLVFLKPKQNNCDASITEVLSDRLQETDVKILEQYKKHFTKKEGGNQYDENSCESLLLRRSRKLLLFGDLPPDGGRQWQQEARLLGDLRLPPKEEQSRWRKEDHDDQRVHSVGRRRSQV